MGLVYFNGRFVPEEHIQKTASKDRVLRLLRSYVDENSPSLVRFLVNTWRAEGKAITYKELREAIQAGDISEEWLKDWIQDYSRLVTKHLYPAWLEAMAAAAAERERKHPGWYFSPMAQGVRAWTDAHTATLITQVTTTQFEALRAVIQRAAVLQDMSVDELARVIRPMIGLTKPQAEANLRYYEKLIESGLSEKRARDLSAKYAARQHRYRAMSIARNELAEAYNAGAHEATKQAIEAGYLPQMVKVWSTSMDEFRRCDACKALEGAIVGMDEEFTVTSKSGRRTTSLRPPLHPQCMCAVEYVPADSV